MSDTLTSANGRYKLVMQDDGNLVIYGANGPVWASNSPTPQPQPPIPPVKPVTALTPLRVESGRLRNDEGFLHWRGISEFSLVHLRRTAKAAEAEARMARAAGARRNGIRVLAMAANLFDLRPGYPGYWEAVDWVIAKAGALGLYTELVLFADAQTVMPSPADRSSFTQQMATLLRGRPTALPQLANEPFQNGWSSATDPQLLELAGLFSSNYDGRPFSIGDPNDTVENPDTGAPLKTDLDALAKRSPVLVLHGERKPRDDRWAGWVDHLKGFDEIGVGHGTHYLIHDEPMGAASAYQNGRRDNRPLAHLAAQLVCAILGIGFTYHYIAEQDPATPGLDLCDVARVIPASPDYVFRNAGTAGACVTRFSGHDKVRTCDNGREAWAVGYGFTGGTVEWAAGWTGGIFSNWQHPSGDRESCGEVTLYRATK